MGEGSTPTSDVCIHSLVGILTGIPLMSGLFGGVYMYHDMKGTLAVSGHTRVCFDRTDVQAIRTTSSAPAASSSPQYTEYRKILVEGA